MLHPFALSLLCATSLAGTAQNIALGEYWIDADPGFGAGLPFDPALVPAPDILPTATTLALTGLELGFHVIGYRTKDDNARWSLTNLRPIYIADSSNGVIVEVEYFWDVDPGFGLSPLDSVLANPATDWSDTIVAAVPLGIMWGNHILFMRSRDSRGRWSLTNVVDSVNVNGTTDVETLSEQTGINVYPNPFAETITVSATDAKPLRFILYDPQGKLVLDRLFTQQETFDLKSHASGVYQAYFWQEADRIHAVKLVKQ